jgi:hypothetical protein
LPAESRAKRGGRIDAGVDRTPSHPTGRVQIASRGRKVRASLAALLICAGALCATASADGSQASRAAPAAARHLPASIRDAGHWVRAHGRTVWMAPLALRVNKKGRLLARAASVNTACTSFFGPNAGPQPTGNKGCISVLADRGAGAGYCMSSPGQKQGSSSYVVEAACNAKAANQNWWVVATGVNGTFEIWNAGSSCPASLAWNDCGELYGSAPNEGNGYCLNVKGLNGGDNVSLIMWGCKTGSIASMSFTASGFGTNTSIVYTGNRPGDYCVSDLGNHGNGYGYQLFQCNTSENQRFDGGTLEFPSTK